VCYIPNNHPRLRLVTSDAVIESSDELSTHRLPFAMIDPSSSILASGKHCRSAASLFFAGRCHGFQTFLSLFYSSSSTVTGTRTTMRPLWSSVSVCSVCVFLMLRRCSAGALRGCRKPTAMLERELSVEGKMETPKIR
jgi:hypothetical protein